MLVNCPHCRSRFPVSGEAAGKTATCPNPKCGTTVFIPVPAVAPSSGGKRGEPGPLQPYARRSSAGTSEITIQLDPVAVRRPSSVTVHASQPSNSMGIVSLVVGIVALLLCWLPMMNRLGYAIGALGVLLGLLGLIVALQQRGANIGFPVGGLALSVVGLVLAFQMDRGVQDIKTAVGKVFSEGAGNRKGSKLGSDSRKPVKATQEEASEPKRWVDATRIVLTRGDAAVKVTSARVGTVACKGINGRREVGPYLLLELRVTNRSETRKLDFTGWSDELDFIGPKCSLVDEHGNTYAQMKAGLGELWEGPVSNATVAPRSVMTDLLVFELPVKAAKELHLEIPAVPLGGDGWYRFSIPRQMWDGEAESPP